MTSTHFSLNRRKDIDGLRGLAVLSVVLYHVFPSVVRAGFIGVDIFFVISGYLISRIIFDACDKKNFSFIKFYVRRIRRIFPALFVVLLTSYVLGWFVLFPDEFRDLAKHISSGAFFLSNIVASKGNGYFDAHTDLKPLLHLWSLGVEEQFYLVFPLLIFLLPKSQRLFALIFLFILSFSINLHGVHAQKFSTYYLSTTRFWQLLMGSVLAWISLYKTDLDYLLLKKISLQKCGCIKNIGNYADFLSVIGITIFLFSLFLINPKHGYPGILGLLPTLSAFLIILSGERVDVTNRLLASNILVWFGLISFPLYLWHWPILSFGYILQNSEFPSVVIGIISVICSIFLAWVTFKFIEIPVRVQMRFNTSFIFLAVLFIGLIGIWTYEKQGVVDRNPTFFKINNSINDWEFPGKLIKNLDYSATYSNVKANPEVIGFGDSHIEQYAPRVNYLTALGKAKNVTFLTSGGCPPIPNVYENSRLNCFGNVARFRRYLDDNPTIKTIFLSGCFNCYFIEETRINVKNQRTDYYFLSKEGVKSFRGGVGRDLAILQFGRFVKELSLKYNVYVLLDNPMDKRFDPKRILFSEESGGRPFLIINQHELTNIKFPILEDNLLIERLLEQSLEGSNVKIIRTSEWICPNKVCSSVDEKHEPIYKDNNHLRAQFVKDLRVIDEVISK